MRKQRLESNEGAKHADTGRKAFLAEGKATAEQQGQSTDAVSEQQLNRLYFPKTAPIISPIQRAPSQLGTADTPLNR